MDQRNLWVSGGILGTNIYGRTSRHACQNIFLVLTMNNERTREEVNTPISENFSKTQTTRNTRLSRIIHQHSKHAKT